MHIKHPEKFTNHKNYHLLLERLSNGLLLGIENRGRDATGFVAVTTEGAIKLDKNNVPAQDFVETRKSLPPNARTVLLHTRLATQGAPEVWANNHPVFYKDCFTVHNGTIYNDNTLFEEHELDRVAEVDSEIIPALLHKFGFDNADKAFAELRGGFATASIHPAKYPDVTLLGKGGQWPLHVLETKDVLIWASTIEAIKGAWGGVLGTPPTKGWAVLGSGDIWLLKGDTVEKKPRAFEHKSWTSSSSSRAQSNEYAYDWEKWFSGDEDETWPYSETEPYLGQGNRQYVVDRNKSVGVGFTRNHTVLDFEQPIRELRNKGKGACVTYASRESVTGKAYLEKYGNGRWIYCVHCKTSVAEPQTIKSSTQYGDICIDCYTLAKVRYPEQDGNRKDLLVKVGMREDDFEKLDRFADTATYIHNQALYAIARVTGVKRTTLDFIVNRADTHVLEQSKELTDLYCELTDLYTEKLSELWQAWAADEVDNDGDASDPYVTCASGTHRQSLECEACKAAEAESCGVQTFSEEDDKRVLYDSARPDRCLLCRRKPTYYLGLTHAWCTRHKNKCSIKSCKEVAVGYLPDNTRRCHAHSRRQKSFIADNDYQARRRALAHA